MTNLPACYRKGKELFSAKENNGLLQKIKMDDKRKNEKQNIIKFIKKFFLFVTVLVFLDF